MVEEQESLKREESLTRDDMARDVRHRLDLEKALERCVYSAYGIYLLPCYSGASCKPSYKLFDKHIQHCAMYGSML